jgi:hypothetical protein
MQDQGGGIEHSWTQTQMYSEGSAEDVRQIRKFQALACNANQYPPAKILAGMTRK